MEKWETDNVPVYAWVDGVAVEESAKKQLLEVALMPFIFKHVAVMPDCHMGIGATIGSVIASKSAVMPSAVGVDIGCGVSVTETNLPFEDVKKQAAVVREAIEKAIPHGRTNNGKAGDRGAWGTLPEYVKHVWETELKERLKEIVRKHQKTKGYNCENHLGTLGTGNHFIELCGDAKGVVWVLVHSGSRGIGNRIGQTFIRLAKEYCEEHHYALPNKDLAFLERGTSLFDDYLEAATWAQDFALANRSIMVANINLVLDRLFGNLDFGGCCFDCHHNYVAKETHFGEDCYVTRKGALRAFKGNTVIIPGSMGTESFIGKGLGNEDSFMSCSHGAGRSMSRTEARKTISLTSHVLDTDGVDCKKDESVLDESPKAYKDIVSVMTAQTDLVAPTNTLKQFICIKG